MQVRTPKEKDLLQEMLNLRESYIKKFTASSGIAEQKSTLLTIAKQDTIPSDFRAMSAKLDSMVEASKEVEKILDLSRKEEKEYKESLKNDELHDIQRKKLKIAVDRVKELFKTAELVGSMLPYPKFNLLKPQLQKLSGKLNDAGIVNTIDFLKFLENEKKLNKYLLDSVEERIAFVLKFKEKIKKIGLDMDVMAASMERLSLASAENNIKKMKQYNIEANEKTIKILEEHAVKGVVQAYADLPPMDEKQEAIRQGVIRKGEEELRRITSTGKISAQLSSVPPSAPYISSKTEVRNDDDSLPGRHSPSSSGKSDKSLSASLKSNSIHKKPEKPEESKIDAPDNQKCSCLIM